MHVVLTTEYLQHGVLVQTWPPLMKVCNSLVTSLFRAIREGGRNRKQCMHYISSKFTLTPHIYTSNMLGALFKSTSNSQQTLKRDHYSRMTRRPVLMGLSRFWGRCLAFRQGKNGTPTSPVFQQCCFFITYTYFSLWHASSSLSLDA
jgi:hypothetical protein